MPERHQWWGYDFTCDQSVDAILAAFNAAGPWQWQLGDSDMHGDYLRCRPKDCAKVRIYEYSQFWTWRRGDGEGLYAELESDPESRSEIDQVFRRLLQVINATNLTET